MRFVWDERKRRTNLRVHGLDFRDAPAVFDGPTYTIEDDRFDYGEERSLAFSRIDGRGYAVVYVQRGDRVRIISMRRAHDKELAVYDL